MWVGGWVSQGLARAPNNPPLSNSLTCTSGIRVSCGWVVWCRAAMSPAHLALTPLPPQEGTSEAASEAAPEAVRQAVGGSCQSGWGAVTVGYKCR